MGRIFVSSVSGLIYSFGVESISITEIVFVQLANGGYIRGDYSFQAQQKMALIISQSHGIGFRTISKQEYFNHKQDFAHDDYVELRLYLIARKFNQGVKPRILALNPEHLSVHFPNPIKSHISQVKASIEQIVRNFVPARAWDFISIDVVKKRGLIFRSTSINRDQMNSNLKKPFDAIGRAFPNIENKMNLLRNNRDMLVLLPLAEHLGGGREYNQRMFLKIREKFDFNPELVLIKNHPTDASNYVELVELYFKKSTILNFSAETERNIPLEILILNSSKVMFAGMFSTSMIGCFQKSIAPSLIFLPKSKKYKKFYYYAQSRQYMLINHFLEEI